MELRHQVTRCLIILFTGVSLAPRFSSLLFGNRLILWCCPNTPMRMSLGVMNFSEDTHSLPLPLVPTEKFSVVREFGSWPAYQRLLCPALSPSSAVSWGDGRSVWSRAVLQRLHQRCQLGTRRSDAHDTRSHESAVQGSLHTAYQLRTYQQSN